MLVKTDLLGISITNASREEILEYFVDLVENTSQKILVTTPNPEMLVFAHKDKTFRKVLNSSQIALCDGVGVRVSSIILGKPLKERFAGVDFVESVCEKVVKKPITVGFLGGGPGVAEKAAECLQTTYPGLAVVFAEAGNPDQKTAQNIQRLVKENAKHQTSKETEGAKGTEETNGTKEGDGVKKAQKLHQEGSKNINSAIGETKIDILFVAFGFPKQERWIDEYKKQLPVKAFVTVGGSLDYISGAVQRAPGFVRSIGLEWLFRLIREPWRVKRQLALIVFMWLVLQEKFFSGRVKGKIKD